jgi:ectoine hydroxylase-related dioxygenase (phytanoyl-CoA dioxygenase family)
MTQKPAVKRSAFKKYFGNFRSFYYYLNKSMRNPALRKAMYLLVRSMMPKTVSTVTPEALARFKKDGIIVFDQLADASTVSRIREYLMEKPVYNWVDAEFNGQEKTPLDLRDVPIIKQTKLKYFDADIAQCADIIALANSDKILPLVSAYLGCKPTIVTMSSWWTKAGPDSSEKFYDDMFHRDVDDYKFVKLFVYLSDVGPENGAHCFIRGSHNSKNLTKRQILTDDDINQKFDKNDILALSGKSGTGILEDTWGIHRALPCVKGERLLLHFLYGLTSFNADASPPEPVARNVYNVDAYSNRVYLYP